MPLVSVITCCYNGQPFVAEAVRSVLAQTNTNWELIWVDDGSEDGSKEVVRQFAEQDDRVRYFEHEDGGNRGKATSRNLGITHSRGEYLVFLDADDVLEPAKLQHQVELLAEHKDVDVTYGRTMIWHSWDNAASQDSLRPVRFGPGTKISPPDLMTAYLTDSGIVPCLCSLMLRRTFLDRVGGFDESIQQLFEDQVLYSKVGLHGKVLIDDWVGEKYRQHSGSTCHAAIQAGTYHPWKLNESQKVYLEWLEQYVAAQGIDDFTLNRALARAQRPYNHAWLFSIIRPFTHALRCVREVVMPTT